jgi:UDP-glucose 4-epimerase
MNILITGGAGFIGSHLSEKFLNEGNKVVAIDDLSTGSFDNISHLSGNKNFQFVYATIFDKAVVDRLVSNCDMIVHLAATVGVKLVISNQVKVIENNIHGTDIILKTANRYRKKILIASTSEVYGKNINTPFSEKDDFLMGATINARWSYACTKAIDEFLALAYYKEYNLPVIITRLFNTVGPKQTGKYGMVIPRFVYQAIKNENITVYGTGEQTRCFCHVSDVCMGLSNLLFSPKAIGEIINIGNNFEISMLDLANLIIKKVNSKSKIEMIAYEKAYQSGFEDMQKRVPDISKAKKIADFTPVKSLEEIIDDIKNYMLETGKF